MTVELLLGLGGLLVALATAAFVFIPAIRHARNEARATDVQAHVADVQEDDRIAARRLEELNRLYARVDALEKADEAKNAKISALGRIVTALAEQWPDHAAPPVFDDADLAEVADTIPPKWARRRHRPRTS